MHDGDDDDDDDYDDDDDDDEDDDDDDQDDDADLNWVLLVAEGLLHHRPNLCVTQLQNQLSEMERPLFVEISLRRCI